ncbi:MAG: alcohol dehydrogenase [Alteromonadaceae bacterium]|uniref:iron-containing alcohol dehydrogenase n=1 Tax=Paraglaciecola chathamensis TaxID=368405 RepID=UPI000C574B33|nr:iron-containing alcohol dehydrogenase [Paraglaciecola agarilytica]MBN24807.1 alcohol dehydrogenase [Alteromonadaceae bacterium]|tara:strand:+ start:27318 stop:28478 length:1161 start_codon:yes stop_codon:yes gene_type:complete
MQEINDFEFKTVGDIRFGVNAALSLPALLISRFDAKSILVITDKGLLNAGVLDAVFAELDVSGVTFSVFDGVQADPPEAVIFAAAEQAKNADVVIGIGGGSSMDSAKLAAVLAMEQQALTDMYGVDLVRSERKPLVLIPTTAGTGSEVTPISIVTTGESTKAGVVSPVLYPDVALLDPCLTLGLPAHITAETGVDAMVHAIEAFTSKHKKNPLSDNLALKALALLSSHLPACYVNGKDINHRGGTLLGAMLAGQAFANAPVAAVHALAYPLGGIYHMAHGLTNALMLPHVMRFNLPAAEREYAQLALVVNPQLTDLSQSEQALEFIEYMQQFCRALGITKRLRDYGIAQEALTALASEAMLQTRLLMNNPREVTFEDALALYQQAW